MIIPQPKLCFSCNQALERTGVVEPRGANPDEHLFFQAVWVNPAERWIGFCSRCYDRQGFGGLAADEVSALHWAFGKCDVEDRPEVIEKKIARLLLAVEASPCGGLFAELAYAYYLAGQKSHARTWATKAVSWARKFPGREKAELILRQ